MLVALEGAREWLRDERALEEVGFGRDGRGRAGGRGEEVDSFEDEEARECAAEVGDAGVVLVAFFCMTDADTYVASSVI